MKFTFRQAICTLTVLSLAWSLLPSARALPDTKSESVPLQAVLDLQSNLLQTGYSQDEITVLAANLRTQTLVRLSAQALIPRLTEYVALDYFHEDRLDRYCAYAALHPDYSPEDVVTYVNIGLDQPRYSVYDIVADPYALDVLVNQYHSLGDDYAPELVRLSTDYTLASKDYLRPEAYQWFIRMANAARREGLTLRSVSAYRSYNTQDSLYKRYVKQDGVAAADRYSARPSFSEHQTGLALDINVAGSRYHFEDTSEYQWLIENCWDYGFILRYPSGKTHITGYIYEPWHYRYVGIELAHQLRDSGLTYDEYMARQPVEKAVETVETQAPSFTVDGVPVEFSSLILLDGTIYLSVNELADTLGWSFSWWGDTLRVTSSQHTFSLPGSDLTRSSAVCNGVLYLELSDLIRQLNMSCLQADNRVQISSVRLPDG